MGGGAGGDDLESVRTSERNLAMPLALPLVSPYHLSTLTSLLILEICRTCFTYEPSKWLSTALPPASLYHYTALFYHC